MSKGVKTALILAISLVLFSGIVLAQSNGNSAAKDKNTNKEHHSRLAKAAFWRRHKKNDKKAQEAPTKPAQSKQTQAKAAKMQPAQGKRAGVKKDVKQEEAGKASKTPVKKASVHTVAKSQAKAKPVAKKHAAMAHSSVKHHPAASKAKAQKKAQQHAAA